MCALIHCPLLLTVKYMTSCIKFLLPCVLQNEGLELEIVSQINLLLLKLLFWWQFITAIGNVTKMKSEARTKFYYKLGRAASTDLPLIAVPYLTNFLETSKIAPPVII